MHSHIRSCGSDNVLANLFIQLGLAFRRADAHDAKMTSGDTASVYKMYLSDCTVLAAIGDAIAAQRNPVTLRIPQTLADAAVAAWNRNSTPPLPSHETQEQRAIRNRAGSLALIGLAIESVGYRDGEEMTVVLPDGLRMEALAARRR